MRRKNRLARDVGLIRFEGQSRLLGQDSGSDPEGSGFLSGLSFRFK